MHYAVGVFGRSILCVGRKLSKARVFSFSSALFSFFLFRFLGFVFGFRAVRNGGYGFTSTGCVHFSAQKVYSFLLLIDCDVLYRILRRFAVIMKLAMILLRVTMTTAVLF